MNRESRVTEGVVYAAIGAKYIGEACRSAASLKQQHPEMAVTLFADAASTASCFDNVVVLDNPGHPKAARIVCLPKSPYDRTLHLDADTFICGPITDLFALLEQFDLSIMPAPRRLRDGDLEALGPFMLQIPRSFPQLNSGVMLYRRCANTDALFARWLALYQRDLETVRQSGYRDPRYEGIGDQAAFREALYASPVRWTALPTEYNCIGVMPGYVHDAVKILHGRYGDPAAVAAALNARLGPRVHVPGAGEIRLGYEDGTRRTFHVKPFASRLARKVRAIFRGRNGR